MDIRLRIAEELAKIAEEIVTAGRPRMTKEEFVERAREVHGDDYDYSKVDMDNRDDKGRVYIICKKCGNGFWQRPDKHLDGNGCMDCYVRENNGAVPGQPSEPETPPPPPAQPQQPAQPAQQPVQKPVQQPAPQPASKPATEQSQFQQSKPLAQPVVRSDA